MVEISYCALLKFKLEAFFKTSSEHGKNNYFEMLYIFLAFKSIFPILFHASVPWVYGGKI